MATKAREETLIRQLLEILRADMSPTAGAAFMEWSRLPVKNNLLAKSIA
jgi:hypothetical protein